MKVSHYAEGRRYEPIDVIEDWGLNFSLGNAVKYISRAGRKDPRKKIEDLEKAVDYISHEIDRLTEEEKALNRFYEDPFNFDNAEEDDRK